MSLLKLDGRTTKGKNWKEHLDSGKPLKQGIMICSKICSKCNKSPDVKLETIKCMNCCNMYHCPCLLSPLKLDYVKDLSDNPCFWWYCLECVSIKNDNEKASASATTEPLKNVDMTYFMNFVGNAVSEMKSDIVSHMNSQIEKALGQKLASVHTGNIQKSNENVVPITNKASTFADIVSSSNTDCNYIHPLQNVSESVNKNKKIDSSQIKHDNSNHVILLKPIEGKQVGSTDDTIKLISSSVQGLSIDYCRPRKSGIIALGVAKENKEIILQRLNQNAEIMAHFKTKLPQDKQPPRITVTGISKLVFDGCHEDDTDTMKDMLVKEILSRNTALNKIIENKSADDEEFMEVILIKKVSYNNGPGTYTAALKVSPKIRYAIHQLNNKLFVYLNCCKVYDRFYVTQCYHCQKIGHISDNCQQKHSSPVCKYCSQGHSSQSCDLKDNVDSHCCANCLSSENDNYKENARSHIASSLKCPYFENSIRYLKQNTIDWLPKNY